MAIPAAMNIRETLTATISRNCMVVVIYFGRGFSFWLRPPGLVGFALSSAFTTFVATDSGVCFSFSLAMVPEYNPVDWERPNLPMRGCAWLCQTFLNHGSPNWLGYFCSFWALSSQQSDYYAQHWT